MTGLSALILATLAYSDIFNYPLTFKEIHYWLIGTTDWEIKTHYRSTIVFPVDIKKELAYLKKINRIGFYKNFYFLAGRQAIVDSRLSRQKHSITKLKIAQKAGRILSRIGFIKMISVTGSLAMGNSNEEDDIDLLVITQANRLWLTRPMIMILLGLFRLKVRRFGDTLVKDKICLNMFLEENDFTIKERNLFTAHEITQAKLLIGRNGVYDRFLSANQWINQHLPNLIRNITIEKRNTFPLSHFSTFPLSFLNWLAFRLQCWYMNLKRTNETISFHQAYFHPDNLSQKIKNSFLTRLKTINRIAVGRVE